MIIITCRTILIAAFIIINTVGLIIINTVMIITDGCALFTIFYGILLLTSVAHPNHTKSSVCYDFLENGFCQVIIQLFDNYIFVQQIEAIKKMPPWKKISIHLYIWIVLISMWAPAYLIVPFFYDTNSISFMKVYGTTLQIQLWGVIAYNFYFTLEFAFILKKIYSKSTIVETSKPKIIAIKSIIHCITSSIANVVYVFIPGIGLGLYNIIILAGIHFLFNYKIEKTYRYVHNIYQAFKGIKEPNIFKKFNSSFLISKSMKNKVFVDNLHHITTPSSPCRSMNEFESWKSNARLTVFDHNIRQNSSVEGGHR